MNKNNLIIFGIFFLLFGFSCEKQGKGQSSFSKNFNGTWNDSTNVNFKNCYALFSEIGDSIHMGHYIEFKGESFFESGKGIIKGDSIIYHVDVIRPIAAWGSDGGTHYLKLSEDKNTLKGIFITDSGKKGPLVFRRR